MKLELGSGYSPTPGFVHIDANPNAPDLDILGDVEDLVDIPAESVDELRAVDVLEHLPYRHTTAVLAEWARVLRPGGRLYVQVPDAAEIMRWYVEDPGRLLMRVPADVAQTPEGGAAWRLLGGQEDNVQARPGDDWRLNAHYALFSERSLWAALDEAGFDIESIETNDHPNLCCWAVRR